MAACTPGGAGPDPAGPQNSWQPLAPLDAAVWDPDGPLQVVAAQQRRGAYEMVQELVLENDTGMPGENRITVVVDRGPVFGRQGGEPRYGTWRYRPEDVAAMVGEAFPGPAIVDEPVLRSNAYGPFYSVEARYGAGTTCLLAWQIVDAAAETIEANRVSLRYRECRRTDATDAMLDRFRSLRLTV
ncbi:MAG: cellulose biosynthesis protein BcsN [Deinococcus-Thermus bacterium]|jgi:hypothetical protein|nr:cellulose biosynthesis protein BcsN [Deinococcota bacterium]